VGEWVLRGAPGAHDRWAFRRVVLDLLRRARAAAACPGDPRAGSRQHWQAYNSWAGKSLYGFSSDGGVPANRVSFDRPYATSRPGNQAAPLEWELQVVRFLEREGYDASYQTDVDTDRDPGSLLRHRLVITVGHGEYWTKGERDAFDSARDQGTNLAFMGSNTGYWQVRYEDDRRTIVGYKSADDPNPDPALKTMLFRALSPPRYECALLGVQHIGGLGQADYTVTAAGAADPWLQGTGLTAGATLPNLAGREYGRVPGPYIPTECWTPGLTVLFHHDGPPGQADAVRYMAPSGAGAWTTSAATTVQPMPILVCSSSCGTCSAT
jgi:hypothetical protein